MSAHPGYVCLHLHYLPDIDDGVKSLEAGVALCRGLGELGFTQLVTTPHIRSGLFENRKPGLEAAFAAFAEATGGEGLPTLGLGAEHHLDDIVWTLLDTGQGVPYPGGHAVLIELPEAHLPSGLGDRFFRLRVRGTRVVLAHPERYRPFFDRTHELDPLLDAGALPLLDVMSLIGHYGKAPQRAAERMLDEGTYYAACTDAHKPEDVAHVARGIARLTELVGAAEATELLSTNPRHILSGTAEYD
ncbi:MAG: CpsB/CapC family capsule biosynthesis tyrosine phosphatase [Polyangiales bacterium]|nr:protein tyrosine phosphatase [Myxococcales bacterium]